jgi:hypothetical protein
LGIKEQHQEYIVCKDGKVGSWAIECDATPLKVDGDFVKLSVKGSHMIRWCQKSDWEAAVAMQARSQEDAVDEPEEDQSQGYRM